MQAIVTTYLPPTDNHPNGRIRVKCDARARTYGWNDAIGIEANHRAAIAAHARALGWNGDWHVGSLGSGSYVATLDTREPIEIRAPIEHTPQTGRSIRDWSELASDPKVSNIIVRYNGERCYFLGWCDRTDEGIVGEDAKMRPIRLGKGAYTFVGDASAAIVFGYTRAD